MAGPNHFYAGLDVEESATSDLHDLAIGGRCCRWHQGHQEHQDCAAVASFHKQTSSTLLAALDESTDENWLTRVGPGRGPGSLASSASASE